MSDVTFKVSEISTQLAVITEQLKAVPDHESRIRALEQFRYRIAGAAAIGSVLAGFVSYWIGHLVR
jgi:hypothetical protein